MLPGLKWYGHGVTFAVIYGLLWVTNAMEGRLYRPTQMFYRVQGEVMIKMARYEDPMVYF